MAKGGKGMERRTMGKRKFKEAATMAVLRKENFGIISQPSYEFNNIWRSTIQDQVRKRWQALKKC